MTECDKIGENGVVLKVKNKSHVDVTFHVNKRHLSEQSEYFKAMFFSSNMSESKSNVVELKNVHAEDFAKVLDFLKIGQIDLSATNVQDIYEVSCMLLLKALTEKCLQHFRLNLNTFCCLQILWLVKSHSPSLGTDVIRLARYLMCNEANKVIVNLDIGELPYDLLYLFVSDPAIQANESSVFELIQQWITRHKPSQQMCEDLLKCVDWLKMPVAQVEVIFPSEFSEPFGDLKSKLKLDLEARRNCCFACQLNLSKKERVLSCVSSGRCRLDSGMVLSKFRKPMQCPVFVIRDLATRKCVLQCVNEKGLLKKIEIPDDVRLKSCEGFRICSVGRFIYILGGERQIGSGKWNKDIVRYDYMLQEWTTVGSINPVRRHFSTAIIGHWICVFGGFTKYRAKENSVSCFNTQTLEIKKYSYYPRIFSGNIAVAGEYAYLIDVSNSYGSVLCRFDPNSAEPITPVLNHCQIIKLLASFDNYILVISKDSLKLLDPISMESSGIVGDLMYIDRYKECVCCDWKIFSLCLVENTESDMPFELVDHSRGICGVRIFDILQNTSSIIEWVTRKVDLIDSFVLRYYDDPVASNM